MPARPATQEKLTVFVAGASGVIGVPLVRLLVADGHRVVGMTRSPEKVSMLHELGAEAVVCDVFDARRLETAVADADADVVIHELTDLPDDLDRLPLYLARNAHIRREGTANLLTAAEAAGISRFLAQSVAWQLPDDGGAAVAEHEAAVLAFGGVVLRYGTLYGPGTYGGDEPPPPPRVHVDEAARRTVEALELRSTTLTIVED
jgi:nucleoside-diphosphate-sugar epimerase